MKPLIVGLTGQTGAGKTTVSRCFRAAGLAVIDCDLVAREVVEVGSPCLEEIRAAFGPEMLDENGALRRREMARLVFGDPEKKRQYEAIIFPHITVALEREIARLENRAVAVLDAPTLFESGADSMCRCIVSVVAPEELRVKRIVERDGIDRELALLRIRAQHGEAFFRGRSRFVIDNGGDLEALEQAARQTAEELLALARLF